jgi:phosphorylcholine metabolism protein LicD
MYNPGEISKFGDPNLPPWEWSLRQKGIMNKEVMKQNALDFKRIMENNGITIVLIFGTLLGVMRNGDVIDKDSDFDVFCFTKDYLKWEKAKTELKQNRFYIPEIKPLHDEFVSRNGEKIDINWIIPFGKFYVYDDGIYYPKEYFDVLKTAQLFGETWKIPNNTEQLLTDLYGDWKVPSSAKGKQYIYQK